MTLKTWTKISIFFSIFTFFISTFLLIFINFYAFLNWYKAEEEEIDDKLNKTYEEILKESEYWFSVYKWNNFNYKKFFLDIYEKDEKFYLVNKKDDFYLLYDVSNYIKYQINLFFISILWLLFFSFSSFFISKELFIKLALKDIFEITEKLKNIDLNNIEIIDLNLRKDDEIYEIVNSINKFLNLIQKNTSNLKEFNSNVSHEFKTPLMVISSHIEYSQKTKNYEEIIPKIEKQLDILNTLLEKFLFVSKIKSWNVNIIRNQTNISTLLNEIIEEINEVYKEKNIKISNNIKENVIIKTDEKLFYHAIRNLIENSFKYTNNNWKIIFYLDQNKFKIVDNGIWISSEKISNIFDNFFTENTNKNSHWVWLNIVKNIFDLLEYKININSQKWIWSEFEIFF